MKKILLSIVVMSLIVLVIFTTYKNKTDLPSTFSIHLVTDSSSSGGDRTATADLKYSNSRLNEGVATYAAHPIGGGEISYSCSYLNRKWVNVTNTTIFEINADNKDDLFLKDAIQNCSHLPSYPTTVEELKVKIKNKEILPMGDNCSHGNTCYSIYK